MTTTPHNIEIFRDAHSFIDGNVLRFFLFLWFLDNNGILYKPNHSRLIENNILVALMLMVAESRAEEKEVMVNVVVNLINKNNCHTFCWSFCECKIILQKIIFQCRQVKRFNHTRFWKENGFLFQSIPPLT